MATTSFRSDVEQGKAHGTTGGPRGGGWGKEKAPADESCEGMEGQDERRFESMADKDYITAHDVTMAEQARLALMEFERKAGSVYPTHTVSVDSPVAFQQVCKALGMKPHPVESTKGAFSHWVVESASGVQFWHTAPKEAR